jgi:putative phosphoribosyl transferase
MSDASGLSPVSREVTVSLPGLRLPGTLTAPVGALGIVLFAHGSGSSRMSPRNRMVANALHEGSLSTLLFDLLTVEEASDRELVFDIPLLGDRLAETTAWVRSSGIGGPVGYFGASTGAGAALWAAASLGDDVRAIVSRGGRPDLAAPHLSEVRAPTLLIVGGRDEVVLELNREARAQMRAPTMLEVIPGATHLFEEPGALEQVAGLAKRWFRAHLGGIVEA